MASLSQAELDPIYTLPLCFDSCQNISPPWFGSCTVSVICKSTDSESLPNGVVTFQASIATPSGSLMLAEGIFQSNFKIN